MIPNDNTKWQMKKLPNTFPTPFGRSDPKWTRRVAAGLWFVVASDPDFGRRTLLRIARKRAAEAPGWFRKPFNLFKRGAYFWANVHDDNWHEVVIVFPEAFDAAQVFTAVRNALGDYPKWNSKARKPWLRSRAGAVTMDIARGYFAENRFTYSVGRNGITSPELCQQTTVRADGKYTLRLERRDGVIPDYAERMTIEEILLAGWMIAKVERNNDGFDAL